MVTAMAHGVEKIVPVATLEECQELQMKGYLAAAERGGKQVKGFELGNSPFQYMDESLKGSQIAITTTNGTIALTKSKDAETVLVGSFLNLSSIAKYILLNGKSVVVHCAGWKGMFSMEDTLFAGALLEKLKASHTYESDAALMALTLYQNVKNDLSGFMSSSSHARRLASFKIQKDIDFCLQQDVYNVTPYMRGNAILV